MYYYFSCDYPSVIKLNGIYYGTIYDQVKSINVEDKNATFVEICSASGKEENINFMLTDEFLLSPPPLVYVTDLKGGYLIKITKRYRKPEFCILAQEKFNNLMVTAFYDKELKLSIETPNDFFIESFNLEIESAKVLPFSAYNQNFVGVQLEGKEKYLAIYLITTKIEKVFFDCVLDYSFDNGITTTKKFIDIAKHHVVTTWSFANGKLKVKNKEITKKEGFNCNDIPFPLLPYAFLEDFLCGEDIRHYLTENMAKNANRLGEYLGDFIGVMPPPIFRKISEIGLIYKRELNLYKVEYYSFSFEGRKICNIKKE